MSKSQIIIIFIVLLLVVGVLVYRPINKVSNKREVIVAVTDKEVKNAKDEGIYLIYAEDNEGNVVTYEITDSVFSARFNSSDVYGGIKVGNTYKFVIGGSRNQFMSWYPNIYEYELVTK